MAFCAPPNAGASCLNQSCNQLGQTMMDGDSENIIACLSASGGTNCANGTDCQWKAMSSSGSSSGFCGEVTQMTGYNCIMTEDKEGNITNDCAEKIPFCVISSQSPCNGQPLATSSTCGGVSCPSGYMPFQISASSSTSSSAAPSTGNASTYSCIMNNCTVAYGSKFFQLCP